MDLSKIFLKDACPTPVGGQAVGGDEIEKIPDIQPAYPCRITLIRRL